MGEKEEAAPVLLQCLESGRVDVVCSILSKISKFFYEMVCNRTWKANKDYLFVNICIFQKTSQISTSKSTRSVARKEPYCTKLLI